jgi:hypothetical protein
MPRACPSAAALPLHAASAAHPLAAAAHRRPHQAELQQWIAQLLTSRNGASALDTLARGVMPSQAAIAELLDLLKAPLGGPKSPLLAAAAGTLNLELLGSAQAAAGGSGAGGGGGAGGAGSSIRVSSYYTGGAAVNRQDSLDSGDTLDSATCRCVDRGAVTGGAVTPVQQHVRFGQAASRWHPPKGSVRPLPGHLAGALLQPNTGTAGGGGGCLGCSRAGEVLVPAQLSHADLDHPHPTPWRRSQR